MKKMIRDTIKKLIHDKLLWVSIGITVFLEILILIIVVYVRKGTTVYEIAHFIGFWQIMPLYLLLGWLIHDAGQIINFIVGWIYVILFWSLIIYSILKISLKLFEEVR
ncbi:MAG: hypothetical protein V3T58_03710, partial [Candidatus Hydrothermarchaeales archaeon]